MVIASVVLPEDLNSKFNTLCKHVAELWPNSMTVEGRTSPNRIRGTRVWALSQIDQHMESYGGSSGVRMKPILDWLKSSSPTVQDLQRSRLIKSVLQTLLDFGRWQDGWYEPYLCLKGIHNAGRLQTKSDVRQRSRWIAFRNCIQVHTRYAKDSIQSVTLSGNRPTNTFSGAKFGGKIVRNITSNTFHGGDLAKPKSIPDTADNTDLITLFTSVISGAKSFMRSLLRWA